MNAGNPLSIYFNFDSPLLVDQTAEGVGTAQSARLQQFAQQARGVNATAVVVNGYASPEGQESHNATLARNRANAVRDRLAGLLPGVALTVGTTGALPGGPTSYPSLRRADVFITAPAL
ncbi:OmpA family protein [Streptomyces melanogenes]|uniref:OmpA family protein n=1 Tax=Streptomyces melanogenes TaxID=67326 RepID=UPI00167D6F96|nr:OmpA family protein [Streptomyces melanogenes]